MDRVSSLTASPASSPADARPSRSRLSNAAERARTGAYAVLKHIVKHTGTGIVCSVAYFDPGNWGVDLQAGSEFGYKLLFVVLLAGLIAVYMQCIASRLGVVTGLDLAAHCRLLFYNRPKHTRLWRWGVLYPLYVLSEIAIIATDLAELLGSAIALTLLFPALPLYAGVIITALDVLFLLAVKDPLSGQPAKFFEILIGVLVFTVLICMGVIVSKAGVHWGDAFDGFIPSSDVISPGGLYTSIGILGATVMPHSLFLGSALATQERETEEETISERHEGLTSSLSLASMLAEKMRSIVSNVKAGLTKDSFIRSTKQAFHMGRVHEEGRPIRNHAEHENNSMDFVRRHLAHGIVDMVVSLLGLALVINSLIVILASAVFFYGSGPSDGPATLFDAYDLLAGRLGKVVGTLFALALLAAGQSSSIIATLAGQVISEGFIRWKVSPMLRRLLTRCLGLIPSVVVAAALGRGGVSTLLVISQDVLSVVLPFIVFPLLWLCSSKQVMSVKRTLRPSMREKTLSQSSTDSAPGAWSDLDPRPSLDSDKRRSESPTTLEVTRGGHSGTVTLDVEMGEETVDFSIGIVSKVFGWLMWILIVLANGYVIITLALGDDS
ncbi:natural resistance-associated macrophage protein [Daedalea quercina L-15889]|uniref:Natural resistance-associated macrophage protein n=1 Tax=Daedalea quercina L-15889 TaxID=1314783 RepID=A0A165TD01_9APHY|nr:natural resistance-associated macrophage protein [Daedalea quercina L-15889]